MSDTNINNMNIKQLRNEVQLLRDEIAIMKRKYEDILYNLDTDNFSTRVVKQGENMYTKIEQNAESISLQAEKIGENSQNIATLEVTADKIYSEVYSEDENGTEVSRITQNAESITSEVEARTEADNQLSSKITQTAGEIYAVVEENYDDLDSQISTVSIKANGISTRVANIEDGKINGYTLFTQSGNTFLFDGDKAVFTGVIYLTDENGVKKFSIFHDESQGFEQVMMHGTKSTRLPIVIGDSDEYVYIGNAASGNQVATRAWVLQQLG